MSPYTIKCFQASRRYQVEIVGVDSNAAAIGRHFADVFEQVPLGGAPDYVDRIVAIAEKHGVDLILPCSDEESIALSAASDRIETEGRQLACPPATAISVMSDKIATLEFLDRVSVPRPEWRKACSREEIGRHIAEMREAHVALAVKPSRSRGSRDVYVLEPERKGHERPAGHRETYIDYVTFDHSVLPTLDVTAPWLVMEGLGAPAHDTDVLARDGESLQLVPRTRLNPAGIPFRGNILTDSAQLLDIAKRVACGLDASWLFDIDTMCDSGGNPKVIEINPRPSGSLSAAVAAGLPILDNLIALARGDAIEQVDIPSGLTTLPYLSIEVLR
jgi:carbamoyl-phosphate synthase large subunit